MRIQDTDGNDITPEAAGAFIIANTAGMPADMRDQLLANINGEPQLDADRERPFNDDRPFDFDRDGRWTT